MLTRYQRAVLTEHDLQELKNKKRRLARELKRQSLEALAYNMRKEIQAAVHARVNQLSDEHVALIWLDKIHGVA